MKKKFWLIDNVTLTTILGCTVGSAAYVIYNEFIKKPRDAKRHKEELKLENLTGKFEVCNHFIKMFSEDKSKRDVCSKKSNEELVN